MDWNSILDRLESYPWLSAEFAENSLLRWLIAGVTVLVAYFVLALLRSAIVSRLERISRSTANAWDDGVAQTLSATRSLTLLVVALFAASLWLALPDRVEHINQSVVIVTLLIQAALWGNVLLEFGIGQYMKKRLETDAASATMVSALSFVGRLILWSLVAMLALDNIGVDVTALVAGLGVGGIAVALAAQNILGDLFASLSIVLDKPFVLGDFIIVGDSMGTVEKIGLKTTRLRSISGEQLIFANNDLLTSRVRNFKRMYERRVVFGLGVTYQTSRDKLAAIPGMIREIVESQPQTRFDRSHFKEFSASSLDFETVYFVLTPDFTVYMDIQQAINLAIIDRFADAGIEFAYPTQSIFLERSGDGEGKGESA